MEDIEKELEEKSIERDVQVQITELEPEVIETIVPVKKVKKARSEKQIAAFEKARLKRAEGIAQERKIKKNRKNLRKSLRKILYRRRLSQVSAPSSTRSRAYLNQLFSPLQVENK
tara:strand:- start:54 stop:398 length:345 start_codon:yes stop_codon:yes gene_type:complete